MEIQNGFSERQLVFYDVVCSRDISRDLPEKPMNIPRNLLPY